MDYDINSIFDPQWRYGLEPSEIRDIYLSNPELFDHANHRRRFRPDASLPHLSRSNPRLSRSSTPAEWADIYRAAANGPIMSRALALDEFTAAEDAYEAAMNSMGVL